MGGFIYTTTKPEILIVINEEDVGEARVRVAGEAILLHTLDFLIWL